MGFLLSVFESLSGHIGKALTQSTMETVMQLLRRYTAFVGSQLGMMWLAVVHCSLIHCTACYVVISSHMCVCVQCYCVMTAIGIIIQLSCSCVHCVWERVHLCVLVCATTSVCMSVCLYVFCTDMTSRIYCPEVTSWAVM